MYLECQMLCNYMRWCLELSIELQPLQAVPELTNEEHHLGQWCPCITCVSIPREEFMEMCSKNDHFSASGGLNYKQWAIVH